MSEICKVPTISLKSVKAAASAPVVHHHGFSPKGAKLAKAKRVSRGAKKAVPVVDDTCAVPTELSIAAAAVPDLKLPLPLPLAAKAAPDKTDALDDVLTALNKGDADAATAAGIRGDAGGSADGGLDQGLRVDRVIESAATPLPGQVPLATALPTLDITPLPGPAAVAVVPEPSVPVAPPAEVGAFIELSHTPDSDTGIRSDDNLTSNTRPVLEGDGNPGTVVDITVSYLVNGVVQNVVYTAKVDADGHWSLPLDTAQPVSGALPPGGLPDGVIDLKVVTYDNAGNPVIGENNFTVDTHTPQIDLTLVPSSDPNSPIILVDVSDSGKPLPGGKVDVVLTDAQGHSWTYEVVVDAAGKGVLDVSIDKPVSGDTPNIAPGDYSFTPDTAGVLDAAGNQATTHVLTIERAPVVEPSGTSGSAGGTSGEGEPLVYTVNLSNGSGRPTVLDFGVGKVGDTADGLDYTDNITFSNGVTRNPDGSITVPPGVTSFTVSIPTVVDQVSENNETLTLIVGDQSIVGTLLDTTGAPTVAISGPADVNEAAGTITYTVKLSNPASTDVTVKYATADGTAKAGSDFEAASGMVTFKPGQTEATVTVKIKPDGVFEGAENYSVKLSEPVGATVTTGSVTTNIHDDGTGSMPNGGTPADDRPVVQAINNATATEGQNLDFTVTLNHASTTPTTVTLTPASGSADISKDVGPAQVSFDGGKTFTAVSGSTVSVPAGSSSFVVRYAALKDTISEASETFTLSANTAQNTAPVTATGTIVDATGVPTVAISGPADVNEAAGTITYTVKLSNPASTDVTVKYATADGTAKAGSDFEASSGTVTFKPGQTEATVTVKINPDGVFEGAENYSVKLSDPVGATVTTGSVTTTIHDDGTGSMPNGGTPADDRPVVQAINNVTATEGQNLDFTVTLNHSSTTPTTVTLTPASGSADITKDVGPAQVSFDGGKTFTAVSGASVSVPAGSSSFVVRYAALKDTISEAAETFTLSANTAQNAAPVTGTGTIVDATGLPSVAISGPADVNEAAGTITYTVKLSNPASTDVTVKYATADGTAKAGSDFDAAGGMVTFKPGQTEATVTVKIKPDGVFEGAENYSVKLSEPVGATITTGSVTTTIHDDGTGAMPNGGTPADDRPVVQAINNATATEGQNLDFTVTLNHSSTTPTTVTLTPASGSADITKDIGAAQVSFDGGKTFTAVSGASVSVPAGSSSFVVRYAALKDSISEAAETFTLSANTAQNAAPVTATGTIVDATGLPSVAISGPADVNEAAGTITYTVKLSNPASTDVTVKYATADGTAKAGSDFDAASGTVTFKPGQTEATVTVKIKPDGVFEGAENYSVKLSDPVGATVTTGSVTTTIHDDGTGAMPNGGTPADDRPVVQAINNATATEGQNLDFTVTLNHASTTLTVVTLTPASGSADLTKDVGPAQVSFDGGKTFVAVTGSTVSVPAGSSSFVVRYVAIKDTISEASETFTLSANTAQNAAPVTATGTIVDATGVPTVAISGPADVNEAAGTITYTVKLSNPASTDVTVKYATADGTAKAGSDFDAASGMVTFKPGQTEATVTVKIKPDGVFEGAENYSVKLSEPVGATITTGSVTTTIHDDGTGAMPNGGTPADDRPVVQAINNATATEGQNLDFTVTLNHSSTTPTTVTLTPASGSADITKDVGPAQVSFDGGKTFTAVSGASVSVPAGSSSFVVRYAALKDNISEAAETFTLSANTAQNAAPVTATGTIVDATGIPTVAISGPADVNEAAGTITYTVKLSNPASTDVTVKYATADGTAKAGSDFDTASGTVTFKPGQTEATVTVKIKPDGVFEGAENYSVKLSEPVGATITTGSVTTTIHDDGTGAMPNGGTPADDRPVVQAINNATATEGQNLDFTVTLNHSSTTPTTVTLTPASGSADITKDVGPAQVSFDGGKTFTAVSGTSVSVPAGASSFVVRYAALKDSISEAAETFTLSANTAQNAAPVTATGTIVDATGLPSVAISGPADVNEAAGTITYTVKLSNPASTDVTVKYATADGTAKAGSDFDAAGGTVTFKPGQTEATVTVKINADGVFEGAENYSVKLSEPVGATIATGSVTTTIRDDGTGSMPNGGTPADDRPVVQAINNATATEGQNLDFTVTLNHASTTPTTVTLTPASGSADITKDVGPAQVSFDGGKTFTAVSGSTVSVPAGSSSFVVRYATVDDGLKESQEIFTLSAKTALGATVTGTGTILDNDGAALPTLNLGKVIEEASNGITTGESTTVGNSGTGQIDIGQVFNVDPGVPVAQGQLTPDTSINAAVVNTTYAAQTTQGTYGTFALQSNGSWKYELNNASPVTQALKEGEIKLETFKVVDGYGNERTVTVTVEGRDDAPDTQVDYSYVLPTDGTWVPAVGATTTGKALANDSDVEGDKLTVVGLRNTQLKEGTVGTSLEGAFGKLTIQADGSYTYELLRTPNLDDNGRPTSPETFTYTVSDGQKTTEEQIIISFDHSAKAQDPAYANLPPQLSIAGPVSVNEAAGTLTYTVQLTKAATGPVTVNFSTVDGTAKAGDDFSAASGSLSFQPGELSKTVTVKILPDTVFEGAETYSLTLSNAKGADIAVSTATTTIHDDGTGWAPPGVDKVNQAPTVVSVGNAEANEGDNLDFAVRLSGTSTTPTSVSLGMTAGTASVADIAAPKVSFDGGVTFVPVVNGLVTVPAGVGSFVVRYPAVDDLSKEGGENFTVQLKTGNMTQALSGTGTILVSDGAALLPQNMGEVVESTNAAVDSSSLTTSGMSGTAQIGLDATVFASLGSDNLSGTLAPDSNVRGVGASNGFVATTVNGTYGVFTLDAQGHWTYQLDNGRMATQALQQDQLAQESFLVTDANGQTRQVLVDVRGANDLPITDIDHVVLAAADGGVPAVGATVLGNVLANDVDVDGGHLQVTGIEQTQSLVGQLGVPLHGAYGDLVIGADGQFSYTMTTKPNAGALTDTFSYTVSDGQGGSTTEQLVIHLGDPAVTNTNGFQLTVQAEHGDQHLFGTEGIQDVFQWHLSDVGATGMPYQDQVQQFDLKPAAQKGDVLDLADLLPTGANATTLDAYLNFEQVGQDTVIHVSRDGAYTGANAGVTGHEADALSNQNIVLKDVNLYQHFGVSNDASTELIQTLLQQGKLHIHD